MSGARNSPASQRGRPSAIDTERKITDLLFHVRRLHQRNDLLQASLDQANAQIARMQAAGIERPAPGYVTGRVPDQCDREMVWRPQATMRLA